VMLHYRFRCCFNHIDLLLLIGTTHLAAQRGEPVWLLYKPL
jgi:hypothetical protein